MVGEPAGEKMGDLMSGLGEADPFGFEVDSTGVDVEAAGENRGELGGSLSGFKNAGPFGFEVGATGVYGEPTGEKWGVFGDSVGTSASGLGSVDSLGVVIGVIVGVFG